MEDCDKMGGVFDLRYRVEKARIYLSDAVKKARDFIYRLGHGVTARGVENLLKPFSLLPTVVCIFILFYHLPPVTKSLSRMPLWTGLVTLVSILTQCLLWTSSMSLS